MAIHTEGHSSTNFFKRNTEESVNPSDSTNSEKTTKPSEEKNWREWSEADFEEAWGHFLRLNFAALVKKIASR